MWTERVQLVRDVSPAAWVSEELAPSSSTIAEVIPTGFDRYARILHPVPNGTDPVTWAQVADHTGRQVHASVQWEALVGANSPSAASVPMWQGGRPKPGNLALGPLLALSSTLAEHTTTPDRCYFAIWDGWGHLRGPRPSANRSRQVPRTIGWAPKDNDPLLSDAETAMPALALPGRNYLLFQGPLSAMDELAQYDGPDVPRSQSPALFWPADRAWCVATEVDFDSTLVGGTATAVANVCATPDLEAIAIELDASLQADGDHINVP